MIDVPPPPEAHRRAEARLHERIGLVKDRFVENVKSPEYWKKTAKELPRMWWEHKNPFSKENTEELTHDFKTLGKLDRKMYWLGAGTKGLLIAAGVANPAVGLPMLAGFALAPTALVAAREGGGWLIKKGAQLLSKNPEQAVANWKKFVGEGKVAQRFVNGFSAIGFATVAANMAGEAVTSTAHAAGAGITATGEGVSSVGQGMQEAGKAVAAAPENVSKAVETAAREKASGAAHAAGEGLYKIGDTIAGNTGATTAEAAVMPVHIDIDQVQAPKSATDILGHAGDPDAQAVEFLRERAKQGNPLATWFLDFRDDLRPLVGLNPNSFVIPEGHWGQTGVPFIDIQDTSANALGVWDQAGPINTQIDGANYMRRIVAGIPDAIKNGQLNIASLNQHIDTVYQNALDVSVGDQLPYAAELTNEALKAQGIPDGSHISPALYNQVRDAVEQQMKVVADGTFKTTVAGATAQDLPSLVVEAHQNFVTQLATLDIQDSLKQAAQEALNNYHSAHTGPDWWAPGQTAPNSTLDLYPTVGSQSAADVFQTKIAAAVGYYEPQTYQITNKLIQDQFNLSPSQVDPEAYKKLRYVVQQKMETMATDAFVKAAGGHYTDLSNVNVDLDKVFAEGRSDFTTALREADIKDFENFTPGRGLSIVPNGAYTAAITTQEIFLQDEDRANVILEEIRQQAITGIGDIKPVSDPQVQALLQDYINDPGITTADKPEEIFANIAANYEKIRDAIGQDKNLPPNFHLVNPGELPKILEGVINGDKAATKYMNDILEATKRGNFQYTIVTGRDPVIIQDLLDALRK